VIDWPQTDCGLTADLRGIVASTCYGICGPIADRFFSESRMPTASKWSSEDRVAPNYRIGPARVQKCTLGPSPFRSRGLRATRLIKASDRFLSPQAIAVCGE